MLHIHFFTPERYYLATDETRCFSDQKTSPVISKNTVLYFVEKKVFNDKEWAFFREIRGNDVGATHLYQITARQGEVEVPDRVPFVAVNPSSLSSLSSL